MSKQPAETFERRASDGGQVDSAELSRQSLRLLESVHFNNFENLLNAMEDFLSGFELCDHDLHFDLISLILGAVIAEFDELDRSKDGKASYRELLDYANKHSNNREQLDWLLCHYEALVKASLISTDKELTRAGLKHAERVFNGLHLVQQHVQTDRIHIEDLAELQRRPGLQANEREAIAELILYLQRLAKRGQDATISARELSDASPELLWSSRD